MEKHPNYRFAGKKPDHIMVSFSGDARTTMSVTWRTNTDTEDGYLLYHEDGKSELKAAAITKLFKSDVNDSFIHWAKADNLKPGTRYYYSCGNDEFRSDEYWFDTEPENLTKFKFLAISDHQKDNDHYNPDYSELNRFLRQILKDNPDIKFIYTAGDNTNCGQHEIQWNAMYEGMKGIIEHIPYMMTCGNHDNRGFQFYFPEERNRYYAEPAEFFNAQHEYSYPKNGPDGWQTENYSFDYGNAHFITFGVNEPELVNDWANEDLKNCSKTWKFGAYHFPIYYAGPNLSNDDGYPMMRECMEKLDILFSGHEHNFSRTYPIKNEELFDRPSQGLIHYELGNGNANPPGTKTCDKIWHCSFYPQEENVSAYAIVEVDGNVCRLTTRLNDGRIVDDCTVDKSKDEIRPYRVAPVFGPGRTRMMYKGVDCGLCAASLPPVNIDNTWYIAAGTLCSFIGGNTTRYKGGMKLELYGKTVDFVENSSISVTSDGDVELSGEVRRMFEGQLYVPIDSFCSIFKMKWAFAERNNFISIESSNESHPVPVQP